MVLSNEELRQLTAKTAILLSPKLHFQPSVLLYYYDVFRPINLGSLLTFFLKFLLSTVDLIQISWSTKLIMKM